MLAKAPEHYHNTLTGATGEHLVAAQLSIRGYSVGLTRGGSRAVDLLASNSDGSRSVAVQVKASVNAWVEKKQQSGKSNWAFMMSTSDIQKRQSGLIYVFVALKGRSADAPDFFVVPCDVVSQRLEEKYRHRNRITTIRQFNIFEHEKESFHGRWDIIEQALA